MKKNRRKNIGYKKERVVLSDVLPYEIPPFFSNRHFYNFLIDNKVCLIGNQLRFKKEQTHILERLIRILFNIKFHQLSISESNYDYFKINHDREYVTIPFKFRIAHKDEDYRELTVIHPLNQLQLVNFYDKYKFSIMYYSNVGRYSLRKPSKIASLKYYKDSTNKKNQAKNPEIQIIETSNKEYTSLKTYFSYEKYSNIYKYYESYEYQKSEKKFNHLAKFDISRCFDSIYTHTLSWALANKKIVKENLGENKDSFGGKFDELMQRMNYNETNGIVIGPEFARVFAEIILQKIDANVEFELHSKGFKYKTDYDICRYVDDFFIFYSDDKIKNAILDSYKIKLQEYNLFFNDSKTKIFNKPIITNITCAKEQIRDLVEKAMMFKFPDESLREQIGIKYFKAKDVITNYKLILSNNETSYKDLQNYFLSIIFNKVKSLIKKFQNEQEKLFTLYAKDRKLSAKLLTQIEPESLKTADEIITLQFEINDQAKVNKSMYNQLYKNLDEIIDLTFFIYSVLPRVTYSIKVCHILFRIIDFIKNQEKTKQYYISKIASLGSHEVKYLAYGFEMKHAIFKKVFDGISLVFNKKAFSNYAEVETLYLLPIIIELGEHYQLSEEIVLAHFNIGDNSKINYFTIISILNYIKRNSKYDTLRASLRKIILDKFENFENNKTEDVFLLIDLLTCPYIASTDNAVRDFRRSVLTKIKFFSNGTSNVDKDIIIDQMSGFYTNWFYKWEGSDFGIELNTKRGHSVY